MSEQEITVVLEFKPEIFDPKKEVLLAIAEEVSKITADPSKATKEDLELINSTKNKLVKARTSIAKAGKAAREAATKYNRDVKSYEDELIAILEPQEIRIKTIEQDIKEYATKQERLKTLPEYKQQLASIGDDFRLSFPPTEIEVTEEEYERFLLTLDPTQFQVYYNTRLGAHLQLQKAEQDAKAEADRITKEAEQKRIDDANAEIEREKEKLANEKYNSRVQRILVLGFIGAGSNFVFGNNDVVVDILNIRELSDTEFENLFVKISDDVVAIKARLAAEAKASEDARVAKAAEDARLAAEAKATQEAKEVEEARVAAETKRKQEEDAAEAKRLADEQLAKDKQEQEKKEEAEHLEKLKQAEAYTDWLKVNNYNPATDIVTEDELGEAILYRTVAKYQHSI